LFSGPDFGDLILVLELHVKNPGYTPDLDIILLHEPETQSTMGAHLLEPQKENPSGEFAILKKNYCHLLLGLVSKLVAVTSE